MEATEGSEVRKLAVSIRVTDLLAVSGPAVSEYGENGTGAVGAYTASGSGGTISWDLLGADNGAFAFNASNGELTFKNSPDYEDSADADRDNVYEIAVQATEDAEVSTLT